MLWSCLIKRLHKAWGIQPPRTVLNRKFAYTYLSLSVSFSQSLPLPTKGTFPKGIQFIGSKPLWELNQQAINGNNQDVLQNFISAPNQVANEDTDRVISLPSDKGKADLEKAACGSVTCWLLSDWKVLIETCLWIHFHPQINRNSWGWSVLLITCKEVEPTPCLHHN